MIDPTAPYELTEADLLDLRVRMAKVGFVSDGVSGVLAAAPWITFILSTREYALHSNGFTVALTDRDDVACFLLRNERVQAGYVRSILDPATPPDVALRSPEARAAYIASRNAEDAHRRLARSQQEEAEREARRRRSNALNRDPLSISIEDLLT